VGGGKRDPKLEHSVRDGFGNGTWDKKRYVSRRTQVSTRLLEIEAIASCVTALGVILGFAQIWYVRKQSVTQFEDEMSRQYREILKTIPVKALLGGELAPKEFEQAENGIYHYLDLSNEQVFLRKNNRVSQETWESWRDGIKSNLSRQAFAQVWNRIKSTAIDSFSELKRLEASDFKGDPKHW
jgi:hypothetical protein